MPIIKFPKTYQEQIDELHIGESLLIPKEKRYQYANQISRLKKKSTKSFTVRTSSNELRVWRLK